MKHVRYKKPRCSFSQLSFFGQKRNRTALVKCENNGNIGIHRAGSANNSASFLLLLSFVELIYANQTANYIYNGTQYLLASNTIPNEVNKSAARIFPQLVEMFKNGLCGNITVTNATFNTLDSLWNATICGYQFGLSRDSKDLEQLEFENCSTNALSQREQLYNDACTSNNTLLFLLIPLVILIMLATAFYIFCNYTRYKSRFTRREYDSIQELSAAGSQKSRTTNFVTELTEAVNGERKEIGLGRSL